MWLLLLTLALANEPNAIAEDLGLGQPTVTEVGWRAAIPLRAGSQSADRKLSRPTAPFVDRARIQ